MSYNQYTFIYTSNALLASAGNPNHTGKPTPSHIHIMKNKNTRKKSTHSPQSCHSVGQRITAHSLRCCQKQITAPWHFAGSSLFNSMSSFLIECKLMREETDPILLTTAHLAPKSITRNGRCSINIYMWMSSDTCSENWGQVWADSARVSAQEAHTHHARLRLQNQASLLLPLLPVIIFKCFFITLENARRMMVMTHASNHPPSLSLPAERAGSILWESC